MKAKAGNHGESWEEKVCHNIWKWGIQKNVWGLKMIKYVGNLESYKMQNSYVFHG